MQGATRQKISWTKSLANKAEPEPRMRPRMGAHQTYGIFQATELE